MIFLREGVTWMSVASWREPLEEYLEARLNFYLDMLREMVEINSFTENPEGINAVGECTSTYFESLGFKTTKVPSVREEYGSHHILVRRGTTPFRIAMVSHLDTVYTSEEEERNKFGWRVEGDRIYGPGTIDIKGGTAMIFAVLDAIRHVHPEVFESITWEVLLDASEEDDARDFGALCRERFDEDTLACLVFEAGHWREDEWLLVVARKGRAVFDVDVEGRASHSGTSHKLGANAVIQMAEVVQQISSLTDYERTLTVNVGSFHGGTVSNRVPHHAHAKVEMRAFLPDAYAHAKSSILGMTGHSTVSSPSDGFACTTKVAMERETPPWPRNSRTDSLFELWRKTGLALGMNIRPQERGGLSDANLFWGEVPTIDGMGPAGANAHCSEHSDDGTKEQEYLFVPSFVPKSLLNCLSILELAGRHLAGYDGDSEGSSG